MHSVTDVAKAAGMSSHDLRVLVRLGVVEATRVGAQWVLSDEAKATAIEYAKKNRATRDKSAKRKKNNG